MIRGFIMKEKKQEKYSAKWPTLSEKERDRRWTRVKELMRAEKVECLVAFGLKGREQFDRYLTNDRTGGICIFPLEGELVHLTWCDFDLAAHLESTLRGEGSWVSDMRVGANGAGVVEVLREKGYEHATIGVVGLDHSTAGEMEGCVPYNTWAHILKNMPGAKFKELSMGMALLTFPKSDEELLLVRRAAAIAESAALAMLKVTRPGQTENKIYAAVVRELYANGANGSPQPYLGPLILQSGPDNPGWGAPMWLFSGGLPRRVQKGDLVQAEIFSRFASMEAQAQMCIALGPVSQENKKAATIAKRSYQAGIKALRAGSRLRDVVEAMEEPLKQAGAYHVTPLIHSMAPLAIGASGTGVGMEKMPGFRKYKWKGASPIRGADMIIEPNTVWELEPNPYIGKHRVNIGGTVIATANGAEALNDITTKMHIVG